MGSETAQKSYPPLHFVLFPFMAQGHMIPMVDIARLLAQRGVTITIVTTPYNAGRFKNVLSRAIESGLPIKVVHVKFPSQEAGMPEGKENIDMLDSMELMIPFFKAVNMLEEPVQKLMEEMSPPPSCLISDMCLFYTSKLAKTFNIPKILFHGMCCFCLLCMHVLRENLEILESLESDKEYFTVPYFPDKVEFTRPQVPVETYVPGEWKEFLDEIKEADKTSYGVVVNTFQELEPAYVKDYKEARSGKAWSIGPVSLCNKIGEDKAERGDKAVIGQDECFKWLDAKEEGSVLYVCLGSICNLPLSQLKELGLGLEESERPFIWVIREEEKIGVLVDKEGVKKAVEELMGESDDAKERRRRAKELGVLAHKAVEEGGSSHSNITSLLEDIMQLAQSNN
ncbi:unnamed protein product [Brassica oleracea var. botrytis]